MSSGYGYAPSMPLTKYIAAELRETSGKDFRYQVLRFATRTNPQAPICYLTPCFIVAQRMLKCSGPHAQKVCRVEMDLVGNRVSRTEKTLRERLEVTLHEDAAVGAKKWIHG